VLTRGKAGPGTTARGGNSSTRPVLTKAPRELRSMGTMGGTQKKKKRERTKTRKNQPKKSFPPFQQGGTTPLRRQGGTGGKTKVRMKKEEGKKNSRRSERQTRKGGEKGNAGRVTRGAVRGDQEVPWGVAHWGWRMYRGGVGEKTKTHVTRGKSPSSMDELAKTIKTKLGGVKGGQRGHTTTGKTEP